MRSQRRTSRIRTRTSRTTRRSRSPARISRPTTGSRGATAEYVPWFERWPDLLAWEVERFAACDLPCVINEEARERGYLVVESEVVFHEQVVPITVVYPSETPDLPANVYSDPPILERHQQPFQGNFCLLARPLDDWNAEKWGAADLIAERLGSLLRDSEEGEATVRAGEAPMPEPYSAHYAYADKGVVVVPGEFASPEGATGRLSLSTFDEDRFVLSKLDGVAADARITRILPDRGTIAGKWLRLESPPPVGPSGREIAAWIFEHHGSLLQKVFPPKLVGKKNFPAAPPLQIAGLVYPEESTAEGDKRDAWMFVALPTRGEAQLLHAQVVSEEERTRRIPDLAALSGQKAVVVGLGSLGGDLALHFGRAGMNVSLIDHDRYEANNTVRHALGIEHAGTPKTQAVGNAALRGNPFCEVIVFDNLQFGAADADPPMRRLMEALDGAAVVVETTGSHQLQHLVGRVAWEAGVPMVSCWLNEGSWSGEVMRIVPGRTCCVTCFQTRRHIETVLIGDAAPENPVVVQGCSHPTTSGAGFDAAEVSAMTARLAVQTVLKGDGYPDATWDHAVANFRRPTDDTERPRFVAEALPGTEGCPRCGHDAG
ncbi:MAG: ThiF family adenylyltransferase [Solirubrobacteraceae bacterium]